MVTMENVEKRDEQRVRKERKEIVIAKVGDSKK